eukprot:TRINITY_DN8960_c0_g1_i1.p1 TRINITY_DN8960_c0_g1~~TRINITY_DN8960_c0_g1_i1.p1  ORF type:complete len:687 (+),score=99.95 TRINITY_DN8960_c0_g1_i1:102-2162(+)
MWKSASPSSSRYPKRWITPGKKLNLYIVTSSPIISCSRKTVVPSLPTWVCPRSPVTRMTPTAMKSWAHHSISARNISLARQWMVAVTFTVQARLFIILSPDVSPLKVELPRKQRVSTLRNRLSLHIWSIRKYLLPWDRSLKKMMAKNIKSRYQDAEQLVDDLRMVRRGKRPPTATQGVKAMPGQTKLGMSVTATRRQLQTQLKTINMHLTGMMGKTQTGTIADLDSLASLELKRQQRRRIIFICGIAAIVAVGTFLAIHFMFSSGNGAASGAGVSPEPIEMIKPKPRQAANPYITRINRLLEGYKENPDQKDDFLAKVDGFLETFPSPRSKSELESLNELLKVYVPLDESLRVSPQRMKLEDKYLEELDKLAAEKARKIEEQRRREDEKKRKQEEERQRKLDAERKRNSAEAQRKRQADRFIAELNTRKISLRQKLADMAATEKYDELDKFLSGNFVQTPALPDRAVSAETNAVKDFKLWSEGVAKALKTGVAMHRLIYNGGEKLTGFSVEIKGELVKLESIENGVVNTKPLTGGNADSMPINQLPGNIFRILINKAQKELGDDNAIFYYRLVTGAFAARMQDAAPEGIWKDEYSKYAYDYLKSKLDNASAQEKRALELRYRDLPEFKKLARQSIYKQNLIIERTPDENNTVFRYPRRWSGGGLDGIPGQTLGRCVQLFFSQKISA